MKTLKSITIVACCAALLLVSGCVKEQKPSKPVPVSTEKTNCNPWRNVTGYVDLIDELNGFALCDITSCTGRSHLLYTSTTQLLQAPMMPYVIPSNYVVSTTEQNDIMASAQAFAIANKPSGYSVSEIHFGYQVIATGPPSDACISVDVTYRKCFGGGGGEED